MLGSRPVIFTGKEQCSRLSSQLAASMKKFESLPLDETSLSIDCYSVLMCFVEGIYSDSLSQDPLYKRYVAPIIQEIETNFDTGLTVQELSRRVFITPQYLSRLFVRFFGCSTYEYLTTRRINAAKELLIANPQMEIQETARRTGFDAASHFIAVFKKTTGMTPGEFRKIN